MDVFSRISKAISGSTGSPPTQSSEVQAASPSGQQQQQQQSQSSTRLPSHRRTESRQNSIVDSFKDNWRAIQALLVTPDQAALHHGISRTDLAQRLQDLGDALISEANRLDEESEIAGPCMELLMEGDLLGRLVRLTANDRIAGSQAQVVRLFASLIILLDESFLSRQAVHRPLVRLMRICVGDEFFNSSSNNTSHPFEGEDEDEETKAWRRFGRDGSAEALGFEEDLVDMMCHVASRLRNSPELLIIFFRDRGGDAEAKRAFNRALVGMSSSSSSSTTPQQSYPGSRSSTRPTSPAGSTNSAATIMATMPAISSPLRPPESLPIPTRKDAEVSSNASTSTSLTYDFPLFSYLLRFVHRESRTGELARAGLLFLVDVAFAPGRRNISQARRRNQNSSSNTNRGSRGSPLKRGGSAAASSARVRLDVDFGLGPSLALARYMLESDFAEVLAASLGAVYSLLPSKLASSRQSAARGSRDETSGMSLGGSVLPSVEDDPPQLRGVALTASEEVRKQARLLADLFEFTQDILRTSSRQYSEATEGEDKKRTFSELAQTAQSLTAAIGRSIQTLFLENILYPSLLECSDADGSAVAVMSYLDLMLSVMENDGPLAKFIVGWLIGEERQATGVSMEKRKHKSTAMLQLEKEKGSKAEASTYFSDAMGRYTIKDLLLDHLKRSVKAEASITAIRLASTILTYYGQYSLQGVLLVVADDAATAFPDNVLAANVSEQEEEDEDDSEEFIYPGASKEDDLLREKLEAMASKVVSGVNISQHAREMGLYLSLAKLVERGHAEGISEGSAQVESSSTGFDNYIDDAEQGLIRDSMFWDGLSDQDDGDKEMRVSFRHRLGSQDPLLQSVLEMLCHFWQNAPEVNVALTGLITDLAVCPMRSLEGFIVFDRQSDEVTEVNGPPSEAIDEDVDDDRSDDEILFAQNSRESQSKRRYSSLFKGKGGPAAPILLCILRSLVLVLDHYRPEVSGFDRLLQERRKGLLYVEKLNEALQAERQEGGSESGDGLPSSASHYEPPHGSIKKMWQGIDVSSDVVEVASSRKLSSRAKKISLPPPPSATMEMAEEDKARSAPRREGFARFFGRGPAAAKTTTTASKSQDASSQSAAAASSNSTPSVPQPFAQHYQETSSIFLNMDDLRLSSKSKWSPNYKDVVVDAAPASKEKRTRFKDVDGDSDDESVLYPGREEADKGEGREKQGRGADTQLVNLSALLDNAVILEEFIKELAAILQVRRTNGIDAIRFV